MQRSPLKIRLLQVNKFSGTSFLFFSRRIIAATMDKANIASSGYTHFYATERTVAVGVSGRIGYEVLAAHFALYLAKIFHQIICALRKISVSTGLFRKSFKHIFAHAFKTETVTDAD